MGDEPTARHAQQGRNKGQPVRGSMAIIMATGVMANTAMATMVTMAVTETTLPPITVTRMTAA